ncbi:MAG: HisA/HisF-related TIM barrel protein [Methanosarcinales archaeon]
MFRIIFVLDIFNGRVVHAVRGERNHYAPINQFSLCVDTADPVEIVKTLNPREVYIADLNSLCEKDNNFKIIQEISYQTKVMLDLGARTLKDVIKGFEIADTVILGTETASLELIEKVDKYKISVSIDLKNGIVFTKDKKLQIDPLELVSLLNAYNIKDLIVLNISKVGSLAGIDVEFLSKVVNISTHSVLFGGGVRGRDDLKKLEDLGVKGALVATAIHNKSIPIELLKI